MATVLEETVTEGQLFDPNFLNLEFFFNLLIVLVKKIYDFFVSLIAGESVGPYDLALAKSIASLLIIFFATVIIYSLWGIRKIRVKQAEAFEEAQATVAEKNKKWERVLNLLDSSSESDWKLAIIEADTILGDLLTQLGYIGETIGEQLKGVPVGDFTTVSEAWTAHKVRNQIAHEGMGFMITKRQAKETIDSYRKVFEEFKYI